MSLILLPVIFEKKRFCLTTLFLSDCPKACGITVYCMWQSQSLPFFHTFIFLATRSAWHVLAV